MYTRRDVGRIALGGWAASAAFGATNDSGAGGIRLGATTWSLRDLPRIPGKDNVDDLIKPLKAAGVTEIDLWSYNTEPAGPNTGPAAPPPPAAYPIKIHTFSPEEIAAAMAAARKLLRDFRLNTPANYYEDIRTRLTAAGISVAAYTVKYDTSFTDEETDSVFRQAKALGASVVNVGQAMPFLERLVPVAEKHQLNVALTVTTPFAPASRAKVNLDIGVLTTAGAGQVAWIQENPGCISQITVKDRRHNSSKSEQWGDGDTPIQDVLRLVKAKKYRFPVFAEYEYIGLGTPGEELQRCMDYMRSAVA